MLGDRLTAGQRTLTPSIKVRILVSQPLKNQGVTVLAVAPFYIFATIFATILLPVDSKITFSSRFAEIGTRSTLDSCWKDALLEYFFTVIRKNPS